LSDQISLEGRFHSYSIGFRINDFSRRADQGYAFLAFKQRYHFLQCVPRQQEIVSEQIFDVFSSGFCKAQVPIPDHAEVFGVDDKSYPWVADRVRLHYLFCFVGGAVVDDEDLKVVKCLLQDGIYRLRQKPAVVISGYAKADLGAAHAFSLGSSGVSNCRFGKELVAVCFSFAGEEYHRLKGKSSGIVPATA
jgi:hypothetical protein